MSSESNENKKIIVTLDKLEYYNKNIQKYYATKKFVEDFQNKSYVKEIDEDDAAWYKINNEWRFEILKEEHSFQKPYVDEVWMIDGEGYQDICSSYKVYFGGRIVLIFDKKVHCKIIIKGE
jgi:hypothetical protein